jgi:MFS family permease
MLILSGVLALDIGSLNVVNAALPKIGAHFHMTNPSLQWTVTAYSASFAGFLLFGGRLSDVFGRRLMLTFGISFFIIGAALGGAAPNATILFAARAVEGLGAALSVPATLALLSELFAEGPPRNRALSVYAAVGAAAGSGGFVLGGVLTQYLGWRSVFFSSVFLGSLILAPLRSSLPRGIRSGQPLDILGAFLVTSSLVSAVFGVVEGSHIGWIKPTTGELLVIAGVLLVLFVLREQRASNPLLPLKILRVSTVRFGALAAFLLSTAAYGVQFFSPLYLQNTLHFSPFRSGIAMMPLSLTVFVTTTLLSNRFLLRFGERRVIVSGLTLIGLALECLGLASTHNNYWDGVLPGIAALGTGIGLVFPAMTIASLTGIPNHLRGVAGAINITAQQIGASIGVASVVVISTACSGVGHSGTLGGFHVAYLAVGAACWSGALLISVGRQWRGSQFELSAPSRKRSPL